jgi:hypothetical protein
MKALLVLSALTILITGCATPAPRPPALTESDILSMIKAGMSDNDVLRRIDATRSVFHLSADDVVRLRQEGVSDRVVNGMLDTYVRAAAERQRRLDMDNADFYDRSGPYPRPWWGWWW